MSRFLSWCSLVFAMLILTVSPGVVPATESAGGDVSVPVPDWLIETVDDSREVGYNVSVAVDPETGHSYISYYEGIDGDLWLARTGAPVGNCGPGNAWECQVLDADSVVGKYSSIAVGGDGPVAKLYISYHDVTNGSLKVIEGEVTRATGALTYSRIVVESGDPPSSYMGTETSITLDVNGTPHIGYQVDFGAVQAVKYAVRVAPGSGVCGATAGYGWQCNPVYDYAGIGDYIDIDVGPGGIPKIAFSTTADHHTYPIIATLVGSGGNCGDSGDWQCVSISHAGCDTGDYLSFEISAGAIEHLAYRNATTDTIEWAMYVGVFEGNCGDLYQSYQCEWIDDIGPGTSPAGIDMKIDSDGNPIIAYQDVESGFEDLKIARPLGGLSWPAAGNCGPLSPTYFHTWLCETLDEGNLSHREAYGGLSIALNANGEATVAYRELWGAPPTDGRLKIAREPISIFLSGFESGNTSRWSVTAP